MNAPEAGTIKEFLANEEDTVTVGQDLVKLEIGGVAEGSDKKQGSSEPKTSASEEQATSSDPQPKAPEPKESELEREDKSISQSSPPSPSTSPASERHQAEEATTEPSKVGQPPKPNLARSSSESPKGEPKSNTTTSTMGNRDERRVSTSLFSNLSTLRD